MLWNRVAWKRHGPVYRHVAFDASPQHGQEVFVTVERVIAHAALAGRSWGNLPPVEERSLPVSVLGKGRQGVAEKAQAFVHQTWLEYGPFRRSVREALASVCTVLTDHGAEASIIDCRDIVDECFEVSSPLMLPGRDALALVDRQPTVEVDAFLLPKAFLIHGPQHLLNNVLETSLESEPWWVDFQRELKAVAQWVAPVANRRLLSDRVERISRGDLCRALEHGCDRFAAWRWQTLHKVCSDLVFLCDSVRAAVSTFSCAEEVSEREGVGAGRTVWSVPGGGSL